MTVHWTEVTQTLRGGVGSAPGFGDRKAPVAPQYQTGVESRRVRLWGPSYQGEDLGVRLK